MSSWLNVLLVMAPLGIMAHYLNWGPVAVFVLNFAALVPLALLLGEVTEDLAVRFGSTIGGLLNATFGNVVELILSIAALTKGLYVVIAASLIGSILSNLLLVLGKTHHAFTMISMQCCLVPHPVLHSLHYCKPRQEVTLRSFICTEKYPCNLLCWAGITSSPCATVLFSYLLILPVSSNWFPKLSYLRVNTAVGVQ